MSGTDDTRTDVRKTPLLNLGGDGKTIGLPDQVLGGLPATDPLASPYSPGQPMQNPYCLRPGAELVPDTTPEDVQDLLKSATKGAE